MHDHGEVLGLAAAAIDFELDPDERDRLNEAIETCSLCRRQIAGVRATATVLRRPLDIGTPGRVRGVVVGTALQRGRRSPAIRSMLAAGLSILVVLGGTVAFIGTRGPGILPPASPPATTPGPTAVAQATSSAPATSPAPDPSPSQSAPVSSPAPVDGAPLQAGDIAAMVTDGRLVIRTLPETGPNSALFKTRLYPGQRVLVLEGPVDGDGYPWYRIRVGVIEGWVAAADHDGTPWLAPVGNGVIAFVREVADATGEAIHTINPDGTTGDAVLLEDLNLTGIRSLTWSHDGRRLAFVATPTNSVDGTSEIYAVDADGANFVQLTKNDIDSHSPAWSPDGARLALVEEGVAVTDTALEVLESAVMIIDADGSSSRLVGEGSNPVWSPDGQQIAFILTENGATHAWVQGADGNGRRQVGDLAVQAIAPAWSPDGQQLLVSTGGLSVVDVATGSITPLLVDDRSSDSPPSWSVGGTIAFAATRSAAPGLFVMGSDGTHLRQALDNRGFAAVPDWSPDGRILLLADEHTGSPVTLVDAASGAVVEVDMANGITGSAAWQPILR